MQIANVHFYTNFMPYVTDDGTLKSCSIETKKDQKNITFANALNKKSGKITLAAFFMLLRNYFANEAVCVVSLIDELICVLSAANLSKFSFGLLPITKMCS